MMASAGVSAIAAMDRGHQRLTMLSHIESGQSLSQRVVRASLGLALGHEITMLQQLRSVLLQKPLDRSRPGLVWSDMDIANARCHPRIVVLSDRCEQLFKLLRLNFRS